MERKTKRSPRPIICTYRNAYQIDRLIYTDTHTLVSYEYVPKYRHICTLKSAVS